MKVTLFHNPHCSKSRKALELLNERSVDVELVEYLDSPPSARALAEIIEASDSDAAEFVRAGDASFEEAGLVVPDPATPMSVAKLLAEHPAALQRPIAVAGGRAVIGRPPERVLELL